MHEISAKHRCDILHYLCQLKVSSEEYSKFIKRVIEATHDDESEHQFYDTDPICIGHGILFDQDGTKFKRKYLVFYYGDGKINDCRVYSEGDNTQITDKNIDFRLETNSPDDLNELIAKLTEANDMITKAQASKKNKEESKTRRTTRQANKTATEATTPEPKESDNTELIQKLDELKPQFIENDDAWNKRQTFLARKMQTLERSRILITRQRTRRQGMATFPMIYLRFYRERN